MKLLFSVLFFFICIEKYQHLSACLLRSACSVALMMIVDLSVVLIVTVDSSMQLIMMVDSTVALMMLI